MRICIDATSIPKQPVGVARYIIHLVNSLSKLDVNNNEIFVLVHRNRLSLFECSANPRIRFISLTHKPPVMRLLWEQLNLPFLLNFLQVDILHSPHYTVPWICKAYRVVTFHDLSFILFPSLHELSKHIFFRIMINVSYRLADRIITISDNTRVDLIRYFKISPSKVTPIPLGVDTMYRPIDDQKLLSNVQEKYSLPSKFFLFVGTIEPRKNLGLLLKSYHRYREQGGRAGLVVVGQLGWKVKKVKKMLEEAVAKDQVIWIGYVPDKDLPPLYNLALALVYPTLYEGFGLPPIEAMACGTPVISTTVGAIMENVGNAGILVPPNDQESLTQAMISISNDKNTTQELRRLGLERASHFSWLNTALKTLNVYKDLVK